MLRMRLLRRCIVLLARHSIDATLEVFDFPSIREIASYLGTISEQPASILPIQERCPSLPRCYASLPNAAASPEGTRPVSG